MSAFDSFVDRACEAAWGPEPRPAGILHVLPLAEPLSPQEQRLLRLRMLLDELVRSVGVYSRTELMQLSALSIDLMNMAVRGGRLFLPGPARLSPGLTDLSQQAAVDLADRFTRGDWGDLSPQDRAANDVALAGNGRLLACYNDVRSDDMFWVRVWVLADPAPLVPREGWASRLRPSTLFLLPSEY